MREFDSLYKTNTGRKGWVDGITPEAAAWLSDLADFIKARGEEPVWATVLVRFAELFPGQEPNSPNTISAAVRKIGG